ncbi:hypothetical protein A2U01_0110047, partial [Trifolium medium]|nr:hypothetical protein [Trifolium medium]
MQTPQQAGKTATSPVSDPNLATWTPNVPA